MTYDNLAIAAFCIAFGVSTGSYTARALCLLARNSWRQWRKGRTKLIDKPKPKRLFTKS